MTQLLSGLALIALAAVVGFYGTQLARDGWNKLFAKPAPSTAVNQPSSVEDLKTLSNADLRDRSVRFANEIRTYETNFKDQTSRRSHEEWSRNVAQTSKQTEEQRAATWAAERLRDQERHNQFAAEFMRRYYPIARALRQELARRLGLFPPYQHRSVVLDNAAIAGSAPITEAADYIEDLARQLP